MNTEELVGIYSKCCGDWASYDNREHHYYCGWMSPHADYDDNGTTKESPYFTVKFLYLDPDAVFVFWHDDKIVLMKPAVGDKITFNARRYHAMIPSELAENVVRTQRWDCCKKLFPGRGKHSTSDTKCRVIWKFLGEDHEQI